MNISKRGDELLLDKQRVLLEYSQMKNAKTSTHWGQNEMAYIL